MTRSTSASPAAGGLRRFQQATCERAAEALLTGSGAFRFLVADEVGLGKTRVALGLVRELEQRRRRSRSGTIVIYVTSNSEIANQNVRVLRLGADPKDNLPSRITLLPLALNEVRARGMHVLAFTPGTSLRLRRGLGTKHERALILKLLRPLWRTGIGDDVLEVFRGTAVRGKPARPTSPKPTGFRASVEELQNRPVDQRIADRFRKAVAAEPDLKRQFLRLKHECRNGRTLRDRAARNRLIGRLREILADSCLAGLDPKLVILDEFQRFRWVLDESLQEGTLPHRLLAKTPTLLLSATPYRMRPGGQDLEAQQDFVGLLRFLFRDGPEVELATVAFAELALALKRVRPDSEEARTHSVERVRTAKHAVEELLTQVMSRWERPIADGAGGVTSAPVALESGDVAAYLAFQHAVNAAADGKLRHRDTVEYWKSAPYLVNFMHGYRVKQVFLEAAPKRAEAALKPLLATQSAHIAWSAVEKYRALAIPNARGRYLADLTLNKDQWRALWVPPTLPPYEIQGPFAGVRNGNATKTLVFSGWKVVPPTLAALVGYEAERRAARGELNTPRARRLRSSRQLLAPAVSVDPRSGEERVQRVAVFGLVYPSSVLAGAIDPYRHQRLRETLPTFSDVLAAETAILRPLLRPLAKRAVGSRVDPRWYWAAPMLLDQLDGVDVASLIEDELSEVWAVETSRTAGSQALDASLELISDVLTGRTDLGKRPRDLPAVLARMAIGGLGVCALRALSTTLSVAPQSASSEVRLGAGEAAWGLRTMFNRPEATLVVRGKSRRRPQTRPYWRDVLNYCCDGALQGVLDEYMLLLLEQPEEPGDSPHDLPGRIGRSVRRTAELRALRVEVDVLNTATRRRSGQPFTRKRLLSRYAAAFGAAMTEEAAGIHPEVVRRTFNSPFWPWVLITTSVGQEGLDFHRYCHSVVHWNIPATPVELEQREGRVQRYKSHSVRRNLAAKHGHAAVKDSKPWSQLLRLGEAEHPNSDVSDFVPEWVFPGPFAIERHVPTPPYSRDSVRFEQVKRARVYYRMVLGQPNPDELVAVLMENMPETMARDLVEELRLDLRPRPNNQHPNKR
jgi:hypothetical protein